jgi:hypothetical protein
MQIFIGMKTFSKLFTLLALPLLILLGGCGHNVDTSAPIELNDGQKWTVPAEMMKHVQTMHQRVESEMAHELDDLPGLQANLIEDIDGVIAACTMEGKGHEELHKWLIPFMNHVKGFDTEASPELADVWFNEVVVSLKEFHKYFQ